LARPCRGEADGKTPSGGDRFDQARVAILDVADTGADGQQITPSEE
jgi:hypothetical protein